MKVSSILCAFTALSFHGSYEDSFHETARHKRSFGIKLYDQFRGKSIFELRNQFLGLKDDKVDSDIKIALREDGIDYDSLPSSFDWREKSPDCIGRVRSQLTCGSCWAFSSTSALADRACLKSSTMQGLELSPEDMVLCDSNNSGCNGGSLYYSWQFFKDSGVTNDSCMPYPAQGTSYDSSVYNDVCPSSCSDGSSLGNKLHVSEFNTFTGADAIKAEVYANGPVQTGFTVYQDFFSYSSGVYKQTSNEQAGGHAVEIVGWDSDSEGEYWIIKNSWGAGWGLDGYFNIYTTECGISDYAVAGTPDLTGFTKGKVDPPNPNGGNADSHCTYMNEFNECLTCEDGYTLCDGKCEDNNPNPPSGPAFVKCWDDLGWQCGDSCWKITSGENPVSCPTAEDVLDSYAIKYDCHC